LNIHRWCFRLAAKKRFYKTEIKFRNTKTKLKKFVINPLVNFLFQPNQKMFLKIQEKGKKKHKFLGEINLKKTKLV
jgi:hypothetical protein